MRSSVKDGTDRLKHERGRAITPAPTLFRIHTRLEIRDGEDAVRVVVPDPDVDAKDAELILALHPGVKEPGRLCASSRRKRDDELYASQLQFSLAPRLVQIIW